MNETGDQNEPAEDQIWFASAAEVRPTSDFPEADHLLDDSKNDREQLIAELPIDYGKARQAKMFVAKASLVACVSSVLLGYDIGVMSGALLSMRVDLKLTTFQEEVVVSALNFMAIPGAFLAGHIADKAGRRKTILIAACVFFAGALIMVIAPDFIVLLFGRLVTGAGLGFGLVVGPMYTAELAPAHLRGILVSLGEIFICVGILLGFAVNVALAGLPDHSAWRMMLSGGLLPAFVLFMMVQCMSESPQWLCAQGRVQEAREVLEKGCPSEFEVEARIVEICEALALEQKSSSSMLQPAPGLRHCLFVGCGIAFFSQMTGIESVMYYTPITFAEAGVEGRTTVLAATLAVGVVKLVATVGSALILDDVGRRPLLIVSSIGVTISLVLIAIGCATTMTAFTVVGQCLFVAFFAVGWGPVTWTIIAEVFPLKCRGAAMSMATALNRFTSFVVALTWLSLCQLLGTAGCYALFAIVNAVGVWFCIGYVPETKGLSLEQISKAMHIKTPQVCDETVIKHAFSADVIDSEENQITADRE